MAAPTRRILLVDDSASIRLSVRAFLEDAGFAVSEADSCAVALEQLVSQPPDAAVIDYILPDGTALDILPKKGDVPVVLLTAHGSIDLAVRAIKEGAEQFLTKPVELPTLKVVLERAMEGRRVRRRAEAVKAAKGRRAIDPFVGESAAIKKLEEEARVTLQSDSPVLINGPTGSGKGVLAAWLHENGPRGEEAFVDLNCAGLSPTFLESELFGHERGAFTGAVAAKPGLFDVAHRGTLFLDEIGDVDAAVQPKLLKVVEERRFRRLGEVRDRSVDVRLIAASHANLPELVREKKFRSDLFFRISTLPLYVPPLAERREDVPLLAERLLAPVASDVGKPGLRLSKEAEKALQAYSWPGNVRELRNVLERAALLCKDLEVGREHLRLGDLEPTPLADAPPDAPLEIVSLAENEKRYLEQVLKRMGGRVEDAARALAIPRSSLYDRLRKHGITWSRS
jgi:DNA-binding NtrC family response regulator